MFRAGMGQVTGLAKSAMTVAVAPGGVDGLSFGCLRGLEEESLFSLVMMMIAVFMLTLGIYQRAKCPRTVMSRRHVNKPAAPEEVRASHISICTNMQYKHSYHAFEECSGLTAAKHPVKHAGLCKLCARKLKLVAATVSDEKSRSV